MKVELDNVVLGYSPTSQRIFAGVCSKPNVWRHQIDITQSFISCVIQKYGGFVEKITDGETEWEITVKKIK
jgi:hypothetical protein